MSSARIGDFNGDLQADIFQVDANGIASVAMANTAQLTAFGAFAAFRPWATNVGPNDFLGLVNGDTLLDVVQVYNGNAYVWESIAVPPV